MRRLTSNHQFSMETLVQICQIVVGCGLLNVWLLRFNKATAYRGGSASSMLEEFASYGLPAWSCYLVGFLKVASAFALLAGFLYPVLILPAASVVAASWPVPSPCTSKSPTPSKNRCPRLPCSLSRCSWCSDVGALDRRAKPPSDNHPGRHGFVGAGVDEDK